MPNQPRPDNRPHMIRVPDELWDEAKRKADQRSETISELRCARSCVGTSGSRRELRRLPRAQGAASQPRRVRTGLELPDHLFDYQRDFTEWAVRQGAAASSPTAAWARRRWSWRGPSRCRAHGQARPALTPLAVGFQIVSEAEVRPRRRSVPRRQRSPRSPSPTTSSWRSSTGRVRRRGLRRVLGHQVVRGSHVARLSPSSCAASSTACSAPPRRRRTTTSSSARRPRRSASSATWTCFPGSSSTTTGPPTVALPRPQGQRSRRIDVAVQGSRRRAVLAVGRIVGRAMRRPSDYGYDDGRFHLPPADRAHHRCGGPNAGPDMLFDVPARRPARGAEENRRTLSRAVRGGRRRAREDASPGVAWCHLNAESELLTRLIPGAVEIIGRGRALTRRKPS
jgi:hypothetical protein